MADVLEMDDLVKRLKSLTPVIENILKISGTAGVSVGVLHQQEIVTTASFGYSDIQARREPDEDTLYYIASLTQSITASGIAILVEADRLQWYSAISDLLPQFQHRSPFIHNHTTVEDILSHRTGLEQKANLWMGEHSWPQVTRSKFTRTAAYLEPVHQLGSEFLDNNWTYGLAAQIIKGTSGQDFSDFFQQNIFEPLEMERTGLAGSRPFPRDVDNFAEAYMYNGDRPYRVHKPPLETSSEHEATVGVKSSVKDLLRYYGALISAAKAEISSSETHEDRSPFRQARELFRPHTTMERLLPSFGKTEYTLGLAQVVLPNALGALSGNAELVEKMPRIGEGLASAPLVFYQSGSLVGYQSSAILIPDTSSAIVVLSNTLANQHAPDWIAQAVLEALLDVPYPTDFVALAREAAATNAMLFSYVHQVLVAKRIYGTTCRKLDAYVGIYDNAVQTFTVEVSCGEAGLFLSFNGSHDGYELEHYHLDTFSFETDYQGFLKREMRPVTYWRYFLLEFCEGGDCARGTIGTVVWRTDRMVEKGETFVKRTAAGQVREAFGIR